MKNQRKTPMAYDFQTRLNVVLFAKDYGIASAAREYGVSKSSIQKWLNAYRTQGSDALRQNAAPEFERLTRRVERLEKRLKTLEALMKGSESK